MQPSEYELLLHDAEVRLARLKALYEQYFQGIEKLEPTVPRKDLDRLMEVLRKQQPRNTALRFRMQMLLAKYGTYQTYWQRVARQIEEGTFRRDVVRAQQRRLRDQAARTRQPERENEGPSAWELDVDVEIGEPEAPAAVAFDDTDIDAILGTLGGPRRSEPVPAARRSLSPFALGSAPRTTPVPATPSSTPGTPPVSSAKPMTTFAKPATTTFGKPNASPQAASAAGAGAPRVASPLGAASPPAASPPAAGAPRPVAPPRPPAPPGIAPAAAQPPRPPAPAAAPPRPLAPTATAAPDDARLRKIYESYVEARRRNNERVDNVKFEAVAQSVQQLIPKLREKHGNRPIDFEVVVQNGKVGLKPKVGG